jgi:hypothetical protein
MTSVPVDRYIISTAIALNIYLCESIESRLHDLINEIRTVDINLVKPLDGIKLNKDIEQIAVKHSVLTGGDDTFRSENDVAEIETNEIVRRNWRFTNTSCENGDKNDKNNQLTYDIDSRSAIEQYDDCVRGLSFWN